MLHDLPTPNPTSRLLVVSADPIADGELFFTSESVSKGAVRAGRDEVHFVAFLPPGQKPKPEEELANC